MKRKSPIAKSLIKHSMAAMTSAIEIHNKPVIPYRYEIVTLLVINAWELLLKAYIYKFYGSKSLFVKGNTTDTKPFLDCTGLVLGNLDSKYHTIRKNIEILYDYRNNFSHYHIEDIDILLFSLIKKSIFFYDHFLKTFFKVDISKKDDLILLPIGFKKPLSPLDYLSNESQINGASKEIKIFLKKIIDSTQELVGMGIDESILFDFKINLTNENRITNADIIAGITSNKETEISFTVKKDIKNAIFSNNEKEKAIPVRIVTPTTEEQEIASWIALSGNDTEFSIFLPGSVRLWDMYFLRSKLKLNKIQCGHLIRYSLHNDIPVFYWFQHLDENEIKDILRKSLAEIRDLMLKLRILKVSAHFDKSFYNEILRPVKRLTDLSHYPNYIKYPSSGAGIFFQYEHIKNRRKKGNDETKYKSILEEELSKLLQDKIRDIPRYIDDIWNLDYYIYGSPKD
jgi:hypothetical protein